MDTGSMIEQKVTPILSEAWALAVRDVAAIEVGRRMIQSVRALKKEIEDTFDPIINKAHQAHKEAVAQKKKYILPLEEAEITIKQKIDACLTEIERKARAEAERRAEEERKAREKEMERHKKRLDALCEKAAGLHQELEVVQKELERPDLTEAEEMVLHARQHALMVRIQQSDNVITEKQAVIEERAHAASIVPMPEKIRVEGMATGVTKEPVVVNPAALVKAVAEGRVPLSVIAFDLKAIKKLVNAGIVLPGVSVTLRRNIRVTG